MRIWRASRNYYWNELVVQALLGWRIDTRRTKDYSTFAARPLSELAVKTFSACTNISVVQAVAPIIVTLTRMEDAYASLKYEGIVRPFDMRAAEHAAFPRGGTKTDNGGVQ